MGFFDRLKAVWYAIINQSVSGMEDKHVIALAETKLQQATERLKDARKGLISYQAMVLKVQQQVETEKSRVVNISAQIKTHLKAGQEDMAAELALELSQVKGSLSSNEEQLRQQQDAYENNLLKMKQALKDIQKSKQDLQQKKAVLKMEQALAEVSETAGALNTSFDVSSDLGEILSKVDDQIHSAKARTRVASDLSNQDVDRLKAQQSAERAYADQLLEQFKIEEGLVEPTPAQSEKTVGPHTASPEKTPEAESS